MRRVVLGLIAICILLNGAAWYEPNLALILAMVAPWIFALVYFFEWLQQQHRAKWQAHELRMKHEAELREAEQKEVWQDFAAKTRLELAESPSKEVH
jgi:hypothetical protein